jgi:Ca2+-binding RTX toxin-like protein
MSNTPRRPSSSSALQIAQGDQVAQPVAAGEQHLTDAVDNIVGTGADEVFVADPSHLNVGDHLDAGDGADTLQLNRTGFTNFYHLENLAKLSSVEMIRGTNASDSITIGSGQWTDVMTLDATAGIDAGADALHLTGDAFDLRGKTIAHFEEIYLLENVKQVIVDDLATAELINGYYSQNDHLHITSDDLTDEQRKAYFLRGIDTITDKSGRTTSNLAPQVSGLDGDQVRVAPGASVLLDAGQNVTLGVADDDLFYIQFFALNSAYGDENVHFDIQAGNGIVLSDGMNVGSKITVDTVVIGEISMWSDQWTLDIEFTDEATHTLVEKIIKAVAYRNSSPNNTLIAQHQVSFYIEDNGGRYAEATIDVMIAPHTAQLLTNGVDDILGTVAGEIFAAPLGAINPGDRLDGGDGIDTLQLATGTSNLTQFAALTRVEILSGSAGRDIIQVNAQNLAELTSIQGGNGQDELQLVGVGNYDLTGKTISGIETISVRANAFLTFDDATAALLTRAAAGINASVTLQGGAFTQAQRAQLFRQGVKTITDASGTYTNAAPDAISLGSTNVQEAAAAGTVVGVLFAEDPNPGDAFQFTLMDDAGGRFKLAADGRTVVVASGHLLDYEQAASHTIKVKVTDRSGLSYEKVLTIQVDDVSPETLLGSAGSDVLVGSSGDDILNGDAGADRMEGRGGNDTYYVDHVSDAVVEIDGGGEDQVFASVTFTLGAFVENIAAIGADAVMLTGNTLHNTLTGNAAANRINGGAGNDTLAGGLGNDVLSGGAGKDVFVFDTPGHKSRNKDRILDWSSRDDTLRLDNAIFKKLSKTGKLHSKHFTLGAKAKDGNDFIGVNKANGDVWYDANGHKAGGQVIFATIGAKKAVSAADFIVFQTLSTMMRKVSPAPPERLFCLRHRAIRMPFR